jgi:hypothetical protein
MEKIDLTTECFPVLRIGMYAGPCAVFDDRIITDEKGLHDFIVRTANKFCFDELKQILSPYVSDIKAISIGDVFDHNYGDSWLDIEAVADIDALLDFFKANKDTLWNVDWFRSFVENKYRGYDESAYSDIEERKGFRPYTWQSCLLAAVIAKAGYTLDSWQEAFIEEFYDGYSDFVEE